MDDIAFSDDGRRVAVTIHDAGLMVFALRKSGKDETAVQLRPGTHRVAFTEDGQLFACAGTNQAVGVAEADGGVKESESTSAIRSKSRSETGSGMMNRVVEVRETATGQRVGAEMYVEGAVSALALSNDGAWGGAPGTQEGTCAGL